MSTGAGHDRVLHDSLAAARVQRQQRDDKTLESTIGVVNMRFAVDCVGLLGAVGFSEKTFQDPTVPVPRRHDKAANDGRRSTEMASDEEQHEAPANTVELHPKRTTSFAALRKKKPPVRSYHYASTTRGMTWHVVPQRVTRQAMFTDVRWLRFRTVGAV